MDDDVVDVSNLHRQIGHASASAGTPKAASLARACAALNPLCAAEAHVRRFGGAAAGALLRRYHVLVDASDNVRTRYACNDAAVLAGRPLVSAAAVGLHGQLGVYAHRGGACYRCLHPAPPPPEAAPQACSDVGVLGPIVGVIGSLAALEVLKVASEGACGLWALPMLESDGGAGAAGGSEGGLCGSAGEPRSLGEGTFAIGGSGGADSLRSSSAPLMASETPGATMAGNAASAAEEGKAVAAGSSIISGASRFGAAEMASCGSATPPSAPSPSLLAMGAARTGSPGEKPGAACPPSSTGGPSTGPPIQVADPTPLGTTLSQRCASCAERPHRWRTTKSTDARLRAQAGGITIVDENINPAPIIMPPACPCRLLAFDGEDATFRTIKLRKRSAACSVCGDAPTITSMADSDAWADANGLSASECSLPAFLMGASAPPSISIDAFVSALRRGGAEAGGGRELPLVVDVRSAVQFRIASLAGSLSIPLQDLQRQSHPHQQQGRVGGEGVGGSDAPASASSPPPSVHPLISMIDEAMRLRGANGAPRHASAGGGAAAENSGGVAKAAAAVVVGSTVGASSEAASSDLPPSVAPASKRGATLFVICRRGEDSQPATQILRRLGYDAYNVAGGLDAYRRQADPSFPLY